MLHEEAIALTTREALSGVFGSVSLACWIFLLVPQLIENYRKSSAEAISLSFIFIWFLGDVANFIGALWAGLVPVIIAIAVYFCFADGVLISQCLYYRIKNRRQSRAAAAAKAGRGNSVLAEGGNGNGNDNARAAVEDIDEEAPLLSRQRSDSLTIPGSRRRSSRRKSSGFDHDRQDLLAKILEEEDESGKRLWLKNTVSVLAIIAAGTVGWALAYQSGAWKPSPTRSEADGAESPLGAQILGYASAVAYLGARIPQIVKNARDKSCEGLSLLFFILSLMGNLTYGAGILAHSTEHDYVIKNVPWLIGSLGTMVEDITIFVQFHMYRNNREDSAIE